MLHWSYYLALSGSPANPAGELALIQQLNTQAPGSSRWPAALDETAAVR